MGQRKGKTGNRAGRPKGSPNKLTAPIRERIAAFVEDNFDTLEEDFAALRDKPDIRARVFVDLCKLIVPKPIQIESTAQQDAIYDKWMEKLFGEEKE